MVFASNCKHASTASFLRARAVIKFVLRAASPLENTTGEQQTLYKFSANFTRQFISILCAQCKRSRFYMIYAILEIEQILMRIRACEQLQKVCEHEQASTRLNFASKSSKGQILRAV